MLCHIKVNSNTTELTVQTSCYCILDLLFVTLTNGVMEVFFGGWKIISTTAICIQIIENDLAIFVFVFQPSLSHERWWNLPPFDEWCFSMRRGGTDSGCLSLPAQTSAPLRRKSAVELQYSVHTGKGYSRMTSPNNTTNKEPLINYAKQILFNFFHPALSVTLQCSCYLHFTSCYSTIVYTSSLPPLCYIIYEHPLYYSYAIMCS